MLLKSIVILHKYSHRVMDCFATLYANAVTWSNGLIFGVKKVTRHASTKHWHVWPLFLLGYDTTLLTIEDLC